MFGECVAVELFVVSSHDKLSFVFELGLLRE